MKPKLPICDKRDRYSGCKDPSLAVVVGSSSNPKYKRRTWNKCRAMVTKGKCPKGKVLIVIPKRNILNPKWFKVIRQPFVISIGEYKDLIYKPNGKIVTDSTGKSFYEYELEEN